MYREGIDLDNLVRIESYKRINPAAEERTGKSN